MKKKKISVAVTGSIGSGKSTFCDFIAGKGYPVINADDISKYILANDQSVKQKIIKVFGDESFSNNEINRKYLAEKVFSDPAKVLKINSILHPKVKNKIELKISEHFKKNDIVFTEAALIYEADMESMFDYVVLITADHDIRKKRATADGKLGVDDFNKRNENQIKDEEKKKRADFVFENNHSFDELKLKSDLLINILKGLNN